MSDRWIRRAYSVLERSLGTNVVLGRPLSKETTLRVGGPAAMFATADTFHQLKVILQAAIDYELQWTVLGKGSNVLVSDFGFDGIVIRLGSDFRRIEVSGTCIKAGGGAMLSLAVQTALKHSLGGLAWAIGIPGTLGGAIAGNAGAHGATMGELTSSVTVCKSTGELARLESSEISFGYRQSSLGDGELIVEATLSLRERDPELIAKDMDRFFRRRKETQPLQYPSAGSTFKNPPGDSAGRLIEAAGCKGLTIGGAKVSERHANFIVNVGGASASDVHEVMTEVQRRVYDESGVLLEPEIKMLGDFVGSSTSSIGKDLH